MAKQTSFSKFIFIGLLLGFLFNVGAFAEDKAWWNAEWTLRKKLAIDTSAKGAGIADVSGSATILVRLSDGNFNFAQVREDGSDLRFVSEDGKTVFPHHVERWDSLLNEALVWVRVPDLKASSASSFWLYYGNSKEGLARTDDAKGSFDADVVGVYHFSENGSAPADSSASANNADKPGVAVPGSLIAGGLRLTGQTSLTFPGAPLAWTAGGNFTISAWIKPAILAPNAILLSRREGSGTFLIGVDKGIPFVEISGQRTATGTPLDTTSWHHLAVVANGANTALFIDGKSIGSLAVPLPALNGPILLGKDSVEPAGFAGEVDELQFSKIARSAGWVQLAYTNQGSSSEAAKLLVIGEDETGAAKAEHSELSKHLSLFADISKSLTFDGWVVIILCALLAVVGWAISISKFFYLNKIGKASVVFLKQWETVSTDITSLDHADEENIKSMGGAASKQDQRLARQSPLFHLYHLGSREIQHRIDASTDGFKGLSGRSIAAIKATLDGGQVREVQKLNGKLVYLTIGIAGGPYLGLLGTVIGVMITFAVIAQSGEVEINSIAPGIAGALLATVAGLAVAIPALFAYSYLSSRIKDAVNGMQIFIDEFIARIAEAYPTANE